MSKGRAQRDQLYREDLARIHIDGYGFHWQGAAPAVLDWLQEYGITEGLVVDLGCGGGQWLARLSKAGYHTCGVDISPDMIRFARRNAPGAQLIRGSFADVALPACDAVTSLGEPLNYLNSGPAMRRTMRNVFAALRPDGVFIFDVRIPATGPIEPVNHCKQDCDWFCFARIEEDFRSGKLTRQITSFRRVGNRYQRDEEVHRLRLFPRAAVAGWLREIGFRVRMKRNYGAYQLKARQSVFICRKPA